MFKYYKQELKRHQIKLRGGFMLKPNYVNDHDATNPAVNPLKSIFFGAVQNNNKSFKTAALPAFTTMEEEYITVSKPVAKTKFKTEAEHEAQGCHNVTAFITDNKILLDRYYKMRNEIFQKERGWTKKTWFESDYDRNGKIVVALNDNGEVVGGLRVMPASGDHHLSQEEPGTEYNYLNLLKTIGFEAGYNFAEVDGVIVQKEYRSNMALKALFGAAAQYAESEKLAYLIGIAYLPYCRIYRSVYRSLGYSEGLIVNSFPWIALDEYNNSVDYPIVISLRSKNSN